MQNVDIDGSLIITADQIMGSPGGKGVLEYSSQSGKRTLINCQIRNKGINREATGQYWKQEIVRKEALNIHIQGNGEFFAEDVCFRRDIKIVVPTGYRMVATEKNDDINISMTSLTEPTWSWNYSFDSKNRISLQIAQRTGTLHS